MLEKWRNWNLKTRETENIPTDVKALQQTCLKAEQRKFEEQRNLNLKSRETKKIKSREN